MLNRSTLVAVICALCAALVVSLAPSSSAAPPSKKPQILFVEGKVVSGRDTVDVCVKGAFRAVMINGGRGAAAASCPQGGTIYRVQFNEHKPKRNVKVRASATKSSYTVVKRCVKFGAKPSRSC